MKILFAGGGTMGSVSPLLAIYEEAKSQSRNWEWFWIGSRQGPERAVVEEAGIGYEWLPTVKLRRYFNWHVFIDPFILFISFLRSILIITTIKPDVIISTGSFIAVPVIWAAWLWRKKIIIHQQDIRPTLSNKLTAWCADTITVSFTKSLADYPKKKTKLIGNPVRQWIKSGSVVKAVELWGLDPNLATLLIVGGSTGAASFNEWVWEYISDLTKLGNIIHITGKGKTNTAKDRPHYKQIEFLDKDMAHALAVAMVVLTRAGLSALSELSSLAKASIVVPMPQTHQEDNAFYFASEHAAYVFRQDQLDDRVVTKIAQLLTEPEERATLEEQMSQMMPKDADRRMVEIIGQMEATSR
ncbi:MAG: UDP-N-acetylglucosamine--N-acetylmuramyl-(pentapeptide) pyrophosphoryl-undecaprenol N-acetylglucosamine transferase [Candidatus Komeilibacteria bacterium]|nr:UDP-N-acetylglucosamine--N-acetylmuramyl-(pentapeptide) pyrophosphoryl-undecaprenol N-acetylglucosamine transferase [Candidatus Komeilibacteria bacterium]